jgi:hypothetical protein
MRPEGGSAVSSDLQEKARCDRVTTLNKMLADKESAVTIGRACAGPAAGVRVVLRVGEFARGGSVLYFAFPPFSLELLPPR